MFTEIGIIILKKIMAAHIHDFKWKFRSTADIKREPSDKSPEQPLEVLSLDTIFSLQLLIKLIYIY